MKTSSNGTSLIKEFEGFVANAYLCPAKVWTIGIGTTVYPNGVKVKKGDKCTEEQAHEYLAHDMIEFEKTVNDSVKVPLSQNQFDALVSLAYNIGSGAFKNSTLLKKLNAKDYAGAADQFPRWNKGGGKVLKGLVRRRDAERALNVPESPSKLGESLSVAQWRPYQGPSPATVASANRFSRVAEGFLNHLMLSGESERPAEYERDAVRLPSLPRQHLSLRGQRALCRRDV